jgi:cyclase
VRDAEIIGHRSVPGDMAKVKPASLQAAKGAPDSVPVANAWREGLARFDFTGIELTPPTTLIDDRLAIEVDGVPVEMIYVGPAHTEGDVIAFLPRDGVVFTGDILFRLCAPISWEGTTGRWIQALERIAALDAGTIVPGHGPVCGREGALEMRDYLVYVRDRSRDFFARGVPLEQAAVEIEPGPFAGWAEGERIVFQVARVYRELRGEPHDTPVDLMALAALMVERRERGRTGDRGRSTT